MISNRTKKKFCHCAMCGRKLVERLPNGLLHLKYGFLNRDDAEKFRMQFDDSIPSRIDVKIHGNIIIICPNKTCRHENVINFLPLVFPQDSPTETEKV